MSHLLGRYYVENAQLFLHLGLWREERSWWTTTKDELVLQNRRILLCYIKYYILGYG